MMVPIDRLKPDPTNPRRSKSEEFIRELAQNIRVNGVIEPLIADENYVLIAGENRWRAAKLAGLKKVPVEIRKVTDKKRILVQLAENHVRKGMNSMDMAIALKKLQDDNGGVGSHRLSILTGLPHTTIQNFLILLKQDPDVQKDVRSGKLNQSVVIAAHSMTPEARKVALKHGRTKSLGTELIRTMDKALKVGIHPDEVDRILSSKVPGTEKQRQLLSLLPSSQLHKNLDYGRRIIELVDELSTLMPKIETLAPIQAGRVAMSFSNLQASIDKTGIKLLK